MLRKGDSPYWLRPQFQALLGGEWDILTIMLGTNDAKDHTGHAFSHEPDNTSDWQHDCGGVEHTTIEGCTFATDFLAMVEVIRSHWPKAKIYGMVPPPLMKDRAYGMNNTVINSILPKLVPLIAAKGKLDGVIDIYSAMGGSSDWATAIPKEGCTLNSSHSGAGGYADCAWWCDAQSCDQCHPNDNGYAHLASALYKGLALPPSPPTPPAPPTPPGVWIYEKSGSGKLLIPLVNFTANKNSGRKSAPAWDACRNGPNGTRFDNGHFVRGFAGGFRASSDVTFRGAHGCDATYSNCELQYKCQFFFEFSIENAERMENFP